jgi:Putative addiction module component
LRAGAGNRTIDLMSIAELRQLPAEEKLRIIEILWQDLASADEPIPSPDWHEGELRKTEAEFVGGQLETLDWEEAKRELRARRE